jgi:hypothetical protein
MADRSTHHTVAFLVAAIMCFIALLAAMIYLVSPVRASEPVHEPSQETEAYCLSCHASSDLSITLPSGETLSLYVSSDVLAHSVHSPAGIECEACHTDIKTYPHPDLEYASKRELSRAYYQACWKCHSDKYTQTLDSIHDQVALEGNLDAPVCTDCHGAHNVQPPAEPRAKISETCGHCHTQIFQEYASSIHGSALIQENNPDVPVCTDCHGVHNIHDPRTAQFRVETPDLCASCHANQDLMDKYGLSADVYNLYRTSWHGVDITVYEAKWPTIWHTSAICTDCHGVHNILPPQDPGSTVNPKNLLATCQQCHPNAGPNWTSAWTGHNKISLQSTPFLFYVDAFYSSLTPTVLWLCVIYVVLQIIHSIVERVRSSLP